MKFRVSTEHGDSYSFEAKDEKEARKIASANHEGERFTVYLDHSTFKDYRTNRK